VVTPGFIDARSVVGLSGALNIPTDQDQLEKSSPIQPELRAIDAYNPEEKLVAYCQRLWCYHHAYWTWYWCFSKWTNNGC
jgi:hypothetical protein